MSTKADNTFNKLKTILPFSIEEKTVLWLAERNKYIVTEPIAGEIIQRIWKGDDKESTIGFCISALDMEKHQAEVLVLEIQKHIDVNLKLQNGAKRKVKNKNLEITNKTNFSYKKYYSINDIVFLVEYETPQSEMLLHPKFEKLEVKGAKNINHHFQILNSNKIFSLWVDGKHIGSWENEDSHFLSGKFSMQILQEIYKLEENKWMGVFHAAGITDGKESLMFLGDSGNGKSTLSAILMAHGLDILSDDFLPVKSEGGLVCRFPAAISLKNQAYKFLIPKFPELLESEEYRNEVLNKTFRYLSPKNTKNLCVPCKALVFVKFDKTCDFELEKMPRYEAFQKLVPDSWISPSPENAKIFMAWFNSLPCYRLNYSDNEKMVQKVKEMLEQELL